MKAIKLIALCAATAAILCSCAGKSAKGTQPKGITNEELKNASYMIGYNFVVKEDKEAAKAFATKLQAIDPDNEIAKQVLESK